MCLEKLCLQNIRMFVTLNHIANAVERARRYIQSRDRGRTVVSPPVAVHFDTRDCWGTIVAGHLSPEIDVEVRCSYCTLSSVSRYHA